MRVLLVVALFAAAALAAPAESVQLETLELNAEALQLFEAVEEPEHLISHSCRPSIVRDASHIRPIGAKQAEVALIVTCGTCGDHSHCPNTEFAYWITWGDLTLPHRVANDNLLQLHAVHTYRRTGTFRITVHFCSRPDVWYQLPGCDAVSAKITVV
eukprot:m.284823 g.284823  ORF g.284823 m.284823 type:complete len:157 (-) comp11236_c0_seq1:292-762(-)